MYKLIFSFNMSKNFFQLINDYYVFNIISKQLNSWK